MLKLSLYSAISVLEGCEKGEIDEYVLEQIRAIGPLDEKTEDEVWAMANAGAFDDIISAHAMLCFKMVMKSRGMNEERADKVLSGLKNCLDSLALKNSLVQKDI